MTCRMIINENGHCKPSSAATPAFQQAAIYSWLSAAYKVMEFSWNSAFHSWSCKSSCRAPAPVAPCAGACICWVNVPVFCFTSPTRALQLFWSCSAPQLAASPPSDSLLGELCFKHLTVDTLCPLNCHNLPGLLCASQGCCCYLTAASSSTHIREGNMFSCHTSRNPPDCRLCKSAL